LNRYRPSVITAAITGGDVLPSQSPHLPKGVEAIVEEAVRAADAGATCVHLHARKADGKPSASPEDFRDIARGIRARCDVVLNVTTGGAAGMSHEERLAGVRAARPEIATLNLATMIYEGFPDRDRWPDVQLEWERAALARSGEGVFVNTLNDVRHFAGALKELGVTPECEVYDSGGLSIARQLLDEGTIEAPLRVQLVLGVLGGASNALEDLFFLRGRALAILGNELGSLAVAAVGYPMQLRHAAVALALGMDCRVGLEDNLRAERNRLAEGNAELVERAVAIAAAVGRPLSGADALRKSLGPWRSTNGHKER
jgi:uncharacterized protein (DUF849 family)